MEVWRLEGLPQALARTFRQPMRWAWWLARCWAIRTGLFQILTLDGRYTLTTVGFGLDALDLVTGKHTPVRGSPLYSMERRG